jgi:hypothetical protein
MLPVRQFGVLGFQLAKVVAILENVGFSASKSQVPAADWSGPRNFKKISDKQAARKLHMGRAFGEQALAD